MEGVRTLTQEGEGVVEEGTEVEEAEGEGMASEEIRAQQAWAVEVLSGRWRRESVSRTEQI